VSSGARSSTSSTLADLDSYGIAFVSLRDNLDLSTPSGRLMFQIIGAMAEFERSLIQERVRAGLRNGKLRGKTLGRPRRIVNGDEMAGLREQGASYREIAESVGASRGTVRTRLMQGD
jgi:DNA invertase Pin-like site-specific DNA recombinase